MYMDFVYLNIIKKATQLASITYGPGSELIANEFVTLPVRRCVLMRRMPAWTTRHQHVLPLLPLVQRSFS